MVQYGSDGKVIPHYYGENYRGFDIFPTYRIFRGKLVPIIKSRNPYDDRDTCDENLSYAPHFRCWNSVEECKAWIDKYTWLGQPQFYGEENVLCSSTWDYNLDSDGQWYLF